MQSTAIKIRYDDLRSLAFGSIGASYAGVGASFTNPVRILKINNLTDINLIISFDGVNNKDIVGAGGYFIHDYASNASDRGGNLEQAAGERVYVKQEAATAATTGTVYVTVVYAATN